MRPANLIPKEERTGGRRPMRSGPVAYVVVGALVAALLGVTALVVAHRPSTVALADRVALLGDGIITAAGTHRELMATVPAYADLMTMEEVTQ